MLGDAAEAFAERQLPTIADIGHMSLIETGISEICSYVPIVLRRRPAELRIKIYGMRPGVGTQDTEASCKSLVHLRRERVVLRCRNGLQLADGSGDRERASWIDIARSRRRIVCAQETRQVRSLGPLIVELDQ